MAGDSHTAVAELLDVVNLLFTASLLYIVSVPHVTNVSVAVVSHCFYTRVGFVYKYEPFQCGFAFNVSDIVTDCYIIITLQVH